MSRIVLVLLTVALAGCVQRQLIDSSLGPGEVAVTGKLVAIDTAPWAYDGNAVVQVAVPGHGIVPVHLPARWNLCAAPPVDVEALSVGDDVRVTGTAEGGAVTVCAGPSHGVVRVE